MVIQPDRLESRQTLLALPQSNVKHSRRDLSHRSNPGLVTFCRTPNPAKYIQTIPRGAINCSCGKNLKLFLMTEHFHMYEKWIISIPNESLEKMVLSFFIWWSVQRTNRTGLLAEPLETHPGAPRMHCVTGSIPQRALGDPLMREAEGGEMRGWPSWAIVTFHSCESTQIWRNYVCSFQIK